MAGVITIIIGAVLMIISATGIVLQRRKENREKSEGIEKDVGEAV